VIRKKLSIKLNFVLNERLTGQVILIRFQLPEVTALIHRGGTYTHTLTQIMETHDTCSDTLWKQMAHSLTLFQETLIF